MSDLQIVAYTTTAAAGGCLIVLLATAIRAARAEVPKWMRAKYPRRVIVRSQMPFTEKWMESVDSNDIPILVRARTRRSAVLFAMLLSFYITSTGRLWGTVVVLRMLVNSHR